jgi:FkbM family methyltransferase
MIHGVGASNHVQPDDALSAFLEICFREKKQRIVDVGANVGTLLISLAALGWFERGGEYLGLEPNSLCVYYLEEMLRINSIENACIVPFAASNKKGFVTLHGRRKADKMASLNEKYAHRAHRKIKYSSVVIAETIDNLLLELNFDDADVFKVDVEGHEDKVFQGMLESVKHNRPWITFESWPVFTEGARGRRYLLSEFFTDLDYVLFDPKLNLVLSEMDGVADFPNSSHSDFYAVPNSDKRVFLEFSNIQWADSTS